jgi:hypothetical protein
MHRKLMFAMVLGAALAGCASAPPSPAPQSQSGTPKVHMTRYTHEQMVRLTYCVGLTDTAWSISTMKVSGKTKDQIRAAYANHPNPTLIAAEIDEVYGATYTHPWDYSVQFFRDCAVNVAKVAADSTDTGAYCVQNAMISSLAQEYRAAGKTKQEAYADLPLQGDKPKSLVDTVYAGNQDHAHTMLGAWDACIAPMTDK